MTLQDALKTAYRDDLWLRPVSMRYTGRAFCFKLHHTVLYSVPDGRGGHPASMPNMGDLCGEWEVVTPDTVNREWITDE